MRIVILSLTGVVAIVGALLTGAAQAAQGGGQGQPNYDPATETTIRGTVESVEIIPGPGGGRRSGEQGGTHLALRTDEELVQVHLGPSAFLTSEGLTLTAGDTVEVVGSRVTIGDEPVVIAREVTRGDETWTLRDASGRPMWRGGRR